MDRHLSLAVSGAIIAIVLVLPLMLFAAARALGADEIAPNVSVAGVPVGGMSEEDALATLQAHETALREAPAPVIVKGQQFNLDAAQVNVAVDEATAVNEAMLARRGDGFLEEFAEWIRSFRSPVQIDMPASIDADALDRILTAWEATAIGLPAEEGGIAVVDGAVVAEYPRAGEGINRSIATGLITSSLQQVARTPITLPTLELIPRVTDADVDAAVAQAQILVDGPVTLSSSDPELSITIPVEVLLNAIESTVTTRSPASIELGFDASTLAGFLEQYRDQIERPAEDARFVLSGGSVVVEPSSARPCSTPNWSQARSATLRQGPMPALSHSVSAPRHRSRRRMRGQWARFGRCRPSPPSTHQASRVSPTST